jgi:hypothetical protein
MPPPHFEKRASVPMQRTITAPGPPGWSAWQPRAVLLIVLPFTALYAFLQTVDVPSLHLAIFAASLSAALAAATYFLRAATPAAACLGGLLAYCYALTPAYPHSAFWLLLGTLVLTLGATRVSRKMHGPTHAGSHDHLGLANASQDSQSERRRGRSAAPVRCAARSSPPMGSNWRMSPSLRRWLRPQPIRLPPRSARSPRPRPACC